MRAASRLLQRGFASGGASNFPRRSAALKNKFRGKGLYSFAREEAQRFLEAEVPKGNLGGWMEDGTNAIALSQVLRFFEIQPDPGVFSLMLNRLIRFAEDTVAPPMMRLESVLALMSARPDENFERAFATVEGVLSGMSLPAYGGSPASREVQGMWSILDLSAKVLQRCGKRVPPGLNEQLCQMIMRQIECAPAEELYYLQTSLLRIYAWTVRAELPESTAVLYVLVEKTGNFKSFEFATLMRSCTRHHQSTPLPFPLVLKLAQTGLRYASECNGGDAAAILGGVARILSSLEAGVNDVSLKDMRALMDHFIALLEDYQGKVLHFLDERDPLYWKGVEDVTTIAFAYELGGRVRYGHIFSRFQEYIRREVGQLEPTQLAMATGILRRSNLLSPEIAKLLADRIEVVLAELRLPELSHICATFALLPSPPHWMPEAMEVAMRLMQSSDGEVVCSAGTRFNLSIAFPQETFALPIDYTQLSARQLVDALPLAVGKPVFEGPVVNALVSKLEDRTCNGRFSTDDVLLLLSAPNPAVVTAVHQYMEHRLREAEWSTDVLFMLPIAMEHEKLYPLATDVQKALASAKAAAISPEIFVSFLALLVGIWKDADPGINDFAVVGGMDLIQAPRLVGTTLIRYLSCIQPFPSLKPSVEFLQQLSQGKTGYYIFKSFRSDELVTFLVSIHAFFGNVQTTPALEPVLAVLFDTCFPSVLSTSTPTEEHTARATVLLAHLQQGMATPFLTSTHPVVERVTADVLHFPPDLTEALQKMPIPQGTRNIFSANSPPKSSASGFGGDRRGGRFASRSTSGNGNGTGTSFSPMQRETKQDPLPENPARLSADPLDCCESDPFLENSGDHGPNKSFGGGFSRSSLPSSFGTEGGAPAEGDTGTSSNEGGSTAQTSTSPSTFPSPEPGREKESAERRPESYTRTEVPFHASGTSSPSALSSQGGEKPPATLHTPSSPMPSSTTTAPPTFHGNTTNDHVHLTSMATSPTTTAWNGVQEGTELLSHYNGEGSRKNRPEMTDGVTTKDSYSDFDAAVETRTETHSTPKPQSYYSKFFNTAIGSFFRENDNHDGKERVPPSAPSSFSPNSGNDNHSFSTPQPRRTVLRKNTASTATTTANNTTTTTTNTTTHTLPHPMFSSSSPSVSSSDYRMNAAVEGSGGDGGAPRNTSDTASHTNSLPHRHGRSGVTFPAAPQPDHGMGFSASFPTSFSGWGAEARPGSVVPSVTHTWGTVPPMSSLSPPRSSSPTLSRPSSVPAAMPDAGASSSTESSPTNHLFRPYAPHATPPVPSTHESAHRAAHSHFQAGHTNNNHTNTGGREGNPGREWYAGGGTSSWPTTSTTPPFSCSAGEGSSPVERGNECTASSHPSVPIRANAAFGFGAGFPPSSPASHSPSNASTDTAGAGVSSLYATAPSSSSLWMNTNHPYNTNNRQHFNREEGESASVYGRVPHPSQTLGQHAMEGPLQAAIRATVTRLPTLPGSPSMNHPAAAAALPPHRSATGNTPSPSFAPRSAPYVASGGNIFVDPTHPGIRTSASRPGRMTLSPSRTGSSVLVPEATNRHSSGPSNPTASPHPPNTTNDAHHTSGSGMGTPMMGGGVRFNPHYLRQPTFAPIGADHPKALHDTEASSNRDHETYRRNESATSRREENDVPYRVHTGGTNGTPMTNDSAASSHVMDKRAHQRDMLLREPADRPLAWQSAAQQVSRVSRNTTGKAKTKAHQLLTEWLASPNARLNKKQEKELQQAITPPSSEEKKEGKHRSHHSASAASASHTSSASTSASSGGGRRSSRQQHQSGSSGARRGSGATSSARGGGKHGSTPSAKSGGSAKAAGSNKRGAANHSSPTGSSSKAKGAAGNHSHSASGSSRRSHHSGGAAGGKALTGGRRGAAAQQPASTRPSRKAAAGASGKHHPPAKKKGKTQTGKKK